MTGRQRQVLEVVEDALAVLTAYRHLGSCEGCEPTVPAPQLIAALAAIAVANFDACMEAGGLDPDDAWTDWCAAMLKIHGGA